MDNEDKQYWCKEGEKKEKRFVETNKVIGWDIVMNPGKVFDKYAFDLTSACPCDLKTQETQWDLSYEMFGIPSEQAVTLNQKDLRRYYRLYPNIIILFDVKHLGKVFMLTLSRAEKLIKQEKAHLHTYKKRVNDQKGNAKASYIFDVNDLDELRLGE